MQRQTEPQAEADQAEAWHPGWDLGDPGWGLGDPGWGLGDPGTGWAS